jgi:hypothetical protein
MRIAAAFLLSRLAHPRMKTGRLGREVLYLAHLGNSSRVELSSRAPRIASRVFLVKGLEKSGEFQFGLD